MIVQSDCWLLGCQHIQTSHFDERPVPYADVGTLDLLVIHNISLPPAECEQDFNDHAVEAFFCGQLDHSLHPYYKTIEGVRVSAHFYIRRDGSVVQFVPLNKRAWHAGLSEFSGRQRCNDFSIGIELQGTDLLPYTEKQYQALVELTGQIQQLCPLITPKNIVGHQDIAPSRKTDPGPAFDWQKYFSSLDNLYSNRANRA